MKWFKHETNANQDSKLEKVRMRYGMEGYGLYWYCLELIGQTVEPHNLTFELEHDSEILSHRTGIHIDRIHDMMTYMVDIGLFQLEGAAIRCMKMMLRADEYTLKSIRKSGQSQDELRMLSGHTPEKVPSNRKKERKKDIYTKNFLSFWETFPSRNKGNKQNAGKAFEKLSAKDQETATKQASPFMAFNQSTNKDYFIHVSTFLNKRRFDDELGQTLHVVGERWE